VEYLSVFVAEMGYQKPDPLTYAYPEALPAGTLVSVPFGRKSVPGVVIETTKKPLFEIKLITDILTPEALPETTLQLLSWLSSYYPSGSGAIASVFIPSGLQIKPRTSLPAYKKLAATLPTLTKQQADIINIITSSDKKSFLLHGETGSGKTRVYLERTEHYINKGRSALILTPEISLVPQLAETFGAYFGDKVVVMHSGLGRSQRNLAWQKIHTSAEPLIVIGTRSALFTPLKNIGLVVVDEMHEPAYKQESAPYYHGLRVAGQVARLHGAEAIYGSATPPVTEYYVAEQTHTPILRMDEPAKTVQAVTRSSVDLKDASLFSRDPHLSDTLLAAIEQRLTNHEQSLLFLNRRGTARLVLCQTCGWQALCPRCDTPLIYHGDQHVMRCHSCGYRDAPPLSCPVCSSGDIVYRSMGTKALVETLQDLFPQAVIKRFDTDNTAEEQLGRNFESVKSGAVDILVGTQMLGKGLDLPKLSLVGIVNADTSLSMPDFSSSERNYQLLHQAIGRVGRGHVHGEVIVQSFNPENALLQAALHQRWDELYQHELKERAVFGFPPFVYMLKLAVSRKTLNAAEGFAGKLRKAVIDMKLPLEIQEATPAFYERLNDRYNWQVVIKSKQRSYLVEVVNRLPKGDYSYDLDPINLL
jgi:primosomal protein N' (replication factor Y)